ncbi:hypothetical protein LPJ63_004752 [Coemansia sp. RSA 2711]|nr:hypothetical protein LPJ63_004752 [Coemansia sp. RSA 2711]
MDSFDADAIQACIARGWLDANDRLSNAALSAAEKPQLYKGSSEAAKANSANKWSIGKGSTMANKKDFLRELRLQLAESS